MYTGTKTFATEISLQKFFWQRVENDGMPAYNIGKRTSQMGLRVLLVIALKGYGVLDE